MYQALSRYDCNTCQRRVGCVERFERFEKTRANLTVSREAILARQTIGKLSGKTKRLVPDDKTFSEVAFARLTASLACANTCRLQGNKPATDRFLNESGTDFFYTRSNRRPGTMPVGTVTRPAYDVTKFDKSIKSVKNWSIVRQRCSVDKTCLESAERSPSGKFGCDSLENEKI